MSALVVGSFPSLLQQLSLSVDAGCPVLNGNSDLVDAGTFRRAHHHSRTWQPVTWEMEVSPMVALKPSAWTF